MGLSKLFKRILPQSRIPESLDNEAEGSTVTSVVVPPARSQSLTPEPVDNEPEPTLIAPVAVAPPRRQTRSEEARRRYPCEAAECSSQSGQPRVYEYKKMRNTKTCFRLLNLHRGSGRAPIDGDLLEHSLEGPEVYNTLSYRWMDISVAENHHIHINKRQFAVSADVLEALFVFRHSDRPRKLWIDQICIKQVKDSDKDFEKEHQVENMGKIYSNAQSTLIWLGPNPSDNDRSTIELIRLFRPFREQVSAIADEQYAAMLSIRSRAARAGITGIDNTLHENEKAIRASLSNTISLDLNTTELVETGAPAAATLPQLKEYKIKQIAFFFQAPWFRRTWPIQEVILSREKVVHYGNLEIDWADIGWFARWIVHKYKHVELYSSDEERVKSAMWVYDQDIQYSQRLPLTTMLRMSRKFEASDKKDNVYAVYGMVDFNLDSEGKPFDPSRTVVSTVPAELKPNYHPSKSVDDVYYDVARYLLSKEKSLAILTANQRIQYFNSWNPSWVPNWDRAEVGQPVWLPHALADNFSACAIPDPQITCRIVDVDQPKKRFYTCTVHGKRIGTISKIYRFKKNPKVNVITHLNEKDWVIIVLRIVSSLVTSLSKSQFAKGKEKLVIALALLLTAGRAKSGTIVKDSYAGSVAGKSVTEHVADFVDFILDLRESTAETLRSRETGAFRKLVEYLESLPHPGLANARQGSYAHRCREATLEKTVFRTHSGMLGLGPSGPTGFTGAIVGDHIMVLKGGRVPFILRPVNRDADCVGVGTHRLVGECYVYGAMDKEFEGEVIQDPNEFILV